MRAHRTGVTVAKLRITARRPGGGTLGVHPGRDWFTVLSGTARLQLGDRAILVETGQAAEFSTMVPHAIGAHDGPVEILRILDHDGNGRICTRPPHRAGDRYEVLHRVHGPRSRRLAPA